jgi:hypothetical protein
MSRNKIVPLAALIGMLVLCVTSAVAQPQVESPKIPKVDVGLSSGPDYGSNFKIGTKIDYVLDVSNTLNSGIPGFRVRVFLPGMKLLHVDPAYLSAETGVKASWKVTPGGFIWVSGRVRGYRGSSFRFLAKVTGKVGVPMYDKAVLTLPNGKSATYKLDSYKIHR